MAVNILCIEPDPEQYRIYAGLLEQEEQNRFALHHTDRLKAALAQLREEKYHAILIDPQLPDASGVDSIKQLYTQCPHIPIILLTSPDDHPEIEHMALCCGAQDCLYKSELQVHQLRRSPEHSIQRKRMEAEFFFRSHYDPLTRLPNAALMEEYVQKALHRAQRYQTRPAFMLIEVRNYDSIIETFGHDAIEHLMASYSTGLKHILRECDIIGRWHDESFAVLLEPVHSTDSCHHLAQRILTALSQPVVLDKGRLNVHLNIGITLIGTRVEHAGEVIIGAKHALYQARENFNGLYVCDMQRERAVA